MSTQKQNNKVFLTRMIFLGLILLAIVITISATYITTYNKNKVNLKTIYGEENKEGMVEASEKDFMNNFETFRIELKKAKKPVTDDNGHVTDGSYNFDITTKLASDEKIKGVDVNVSLCLGASWVKFTSEKESKSVSVSTEKEKVTHYYLTVDKLFPAKGPLWFTSVKYPKLYVYITWDKEDKNDPSGDPIKCYTYLTLKESKYDLR